MDTLFGFLRKMRQKIVVVLLLLLIVSVAGPAMAQNPFTAKPGKQPATSYSANNEFFDQINVWQQALHAKMSSLIREAEATGSIKPLLLLIIIAFAYGVIHAVGPGHGKVIALSYVLAQKPSYVRGMLFSAFIALFHGISGIVFVLILHFILKASFIKNLETVTNITQSISYALIACLGLGVFLHGMYTLIKKDDRKERPIETAQSRKYTNPVWPALVVGGIPCPGVAMVMLFALSMNLVTLGIILGLAISVGMALTISLVVLTAISGKIVSLSAISKKGGRMVFAEQVIQLVSGFLLMALGILFLGALF